MHSNPSRDRGQPDSFVHRGVTLDFDLVIRRCGQEDGVAGSTTVDRLWSECRPHRSDTVEIFRLGPKSETREDRRCGSTWLQVHRNRWLATPMMAGLFLPI
jgi:hypothetical protein